jgi:predicted ferric reductase
MAWLGLGVVWYGYRNLQHSHQVKGRAYTAIAILVLGLIIAVLSNYCEHLMTRRHGGTVWNRIASKDDPEDGIVLLEDDSSTTEASSTSIEMTAYKDDNSSNILEESNDNEVREEDRISIRECLGRPTMSELLESLDGAVYPGVFFCAPPSLSQSIRKAAMRKSPRPALYEESFLI